MQLPPRHTLAARTSLLSLLLLAAVAGRAQEAIVSSAPTPVVANVRINTVENLAQVDRQAGAESISGEVVVGVASGQGTATTRVRLEQVIGGRSVAYNAATRTFRLKLNSRLTVREAVRLLSGQAGVNFAEPNYVYHALNVNPNDTYFYLQYAPVKVQADLAWPLWNPKAATVIAIIDTGVSTTHPDLAGKILRDGNGAVVGYDYINNDSDPTDDQGHGTHCAGIAAAQINNGEGVAGIAGWNGLAGSSDVNATRIMPIKVLGADGSGTDLTVAQGITFAADHGAKVISMSLGGDGSSFTLQNAVAYAWGKGCVVVAAAGNSGSSTKSYPAGYDNVIAVASTGTTDTLSSFSNWGPWVTVAAPGEQIASTYFQNGTNNYVYLSGTSMATPLVAGEVALLASQNPTLTNVQLRNAVVSNTDAVTAYTDHTIAGGRVNVLRALQAVTPLTAPSSLTATAPTRSSAQLAWTNTTTLASANRVQYSMDGVAFFDLRTTTGTDSGVTIAGLYPNTQYFFRLRAENANGVSLWSNTAAVRTPRR